MSSPLSSIPPKQLFALISGVIQHYYFHDAAITSQLLKEHVFPSDNHISTNTIAQYMTSIQTILEAIFQNGLNTATQQDELESVLAKFDINDSQAIATWVKVLKDKSASIGQKIVEKNRFSPGVALQWRVDSISGQKKTAFVKFTQKLPDGTTKEVVLELSKAQIDQLAGECQNIQSRLESFA